MKKGKAMFRKPLFLGIVLFRFVSCIFLAQASTVEKATKDIVTQVKAEDYSAAEAAVAQLCTNYTNDPNLGKNLLKIAKGYRGKNQHDKADNLYDQMIQRLGNSEYGQLAGVYKAKLNLSQLLKAENYTAAQSAIAKMKTDFAGRDDLAMQIYIITQSHRTHRKNRVWLFDQVISQFPGSKSAELASMRKDKIQIIRMIWKKEHAAADTAVSKLKADYADCNQLGNTLLDIGHAYKNKGKLNKAEQIYAEVKSKYSGKYPGEKAAVSHAKIGIQELIEASSYDAAQEAIANFKSDYPDSNSLGCKLCFLAESFRSKGKHDKAIWLYGQIVEQMPDDKCIKKVEMQLLSTTARKLIRSGKYAEAERKLTSMKAKYSDEPGFAKELSVAASCYAKMNQYEKAINLNEQALAAAASNKLNNSAALKIAKHKIFNKIKSKDFESTKAAIAELRTEFNSNKELNSTLNEIADKYHDEGNYEEAKRVFGIVAQDHKNKGQGALWAYSNIKRYDLFDAIDANDDVGYQTALNQIKNEVTDDQKLSFVYSCLADKIYSQGLSIDAEDEKRVGQYFAKSIALYEDKVLGHPTYKNVEPQAYLHLAEMYHWAGQYVQSIGYYTKYAEEYPSHKMAWHGQLMIGYNFKRMLAEGKISEDQAIPVITKAYTQLLEKYPDCKAAEVAKMWLKEHEKKSDFVDMQVD